MHVSYDYASVGILCTFLSLSFTFIKSSECCTNTHGRLELPLKKLKSLAAINLKRKNIELIFDVANVLVDLSAHPKQVNISSEIFNLLNRIQTI